MIHVEQAVIVEGKYDKIKLSSIIDGLVISTDGFRIFKDKEKRKLIKYLAQTRGIIILTDSDSAGQLIRGHIKSIVREGEIRHVYIPQIEGKEKRKDRPSKAGTLGVEGLPNEIIEKAFSKAGVETQRAEPKEPITKADFYLDGLSGGPLSGHKRKKLMEMLELPSYLSCNSLLELINYTIDRSTYKWLVKQLEKEEV